MIRRLAWTGGGIIFLGIATWVALPSILRSQIHKRHPEVAFASLDLGWGRIFLHDVDVNKDWIIAHADLATIDVQTGAVHFENGTLGVDLDKKPASTGVKSEHRNVSTDRFNLTVTSEARGLKILGTGVHIDDTAITLAEAVVNYKTYDVKLSQVVAHRDMSHATIGQVEFPDGLTTPDGKHTIDPLLSHIEVDLGTRTAVIDHSVCALDLQQQTVALMADDVKLHLDEHEKLSVEINQLGVGHPWLSPVGIHVHFQHVSFDLSPTTFHGPFDVLVNRAGLHIDPSMWGLSGDESCQAWVDALPPEMHVGPLKDVTFTGRLAFSLGVKPKPFLNISGQCISTCDRVTEPRHKFSYVTYDEHGEPNVERRTTGPDVKNEWVPLAQINEGMPVAVMNMEDFGFRGHHGFLPSALEQSFIADVSSGKFQRGGSTITMQTAKNLWLSREKTFGRKIEELFLSQVLESCFSKDEIMELYLNIVEFGPNVYGLHQAAGHYFKVEPMTLDPADAFYLAWILPRPRKAPPPNEATIARMETLMRVLAKEGRVSETMMLSVDEPDTTGWEAAHP
jgi:Transglycosylase